MTTSTKRPDGGELHREARQSIPSDGFNCVYLYENGREVGCLNGPQDDPEVMERAKAWERSGSTPTNESPAPQPPVEGLRGAFIAGATAVHKEWLASHERGEDHPPRGEPDFSEAATDYAALASPPLTAEPSQVGLNWEISAETKAQIEDIEANTRRAHLNAHNIIVGSPATLTEQSGKK